MLKYSSLASFYNFNVVIRKIQILLPLPTLEIYSCIQACFHAEGTSLSILYSMSEQSCPEKAWENKLARLRMWIPGSFWEDSLSWYLEDGVNLDQNNGSAIVSGLHFFLGEMIGMLVLPTPVSKVNVLLDFLGFCFFILKMFSISNQHIK